MRKHPKWGVLDPASEEEGFGQCLWNVEANMQFTTTPESGAKTLIEIFKNSVQSFPGSNCVGWREFVKLHTIEEGGAQREKLEYKNEYKWLTYAEYGKRVENLAKGFKTLGLPPREKVVIYAETQRDWMASAFAAWHHSCQIVTIYATLGEEGAIHGITQTEATMVIADAKLLKILAKILPQCPTVKSVVTMTTCDAELVSKVTSAGVQVKTIDEVVAAGESQPAAFELPQPSDVAVIMYTSGTTGPPKGVVITHSNIVAVVAGVNHVVSGVVGPTDTYLAYLPLAHIMEMTAEICFLAFGAAMGFGSPHTLTDSGVKLKVPESRGDAFILRPTFMVFAPAVLDKVFQGVQAKKAAMPRLRQKVFDWGLSSGKRHFDKGGVGANALLNKVVFKKVQAVVGGRIKAMITGSAPLSPDIQRFCQTVFNVPVRQGYGLTETCAGSSVAFWGDNSVSTVGPPVVSAVFRLADWPEGNYRNADKDDPNIGMRRGEVLIGGPAVTSGYYINPKNPDPELAKKNEEDWVTIKGIRFFRTGDIGQIKPDGSVQIIDRKKDLWKGPQGEYVALTKVEAALKLCDFVEMPMVYGKTGGEYPVALVCPLKPRLEALGKELGLNKPFADLCADPKVVEAVSKACTAQCKTQKLLEFETPKKYGLISELWTPENDLLTAAMKLKRPLIVAKHKGDIDRLY